MELALYCPDCGFYEREKDRVGRGGDFYTSVTVGPLFGELLGLQFAEWFRESGAKRLQLIEAGAHDGRLMEDILVWLKHRQPAVYAQTRCMVLEPSSRRREWQRERLQQFGQMIDWQVDFQHVVSPAARSAFTIIYSNELLDAFPVRRLGWDARESTWFEWGVAVEGERFTWARLELRNQIPAAGLPTQREVLKVLPDGFIFEFSPAAERWWSEASRFLQKGKLLTFDYGLGLDEFISPGRSNGTLRAFREHQASSDLLLDPGEQDITAHVNFARIEAAGRQAGLHTDIFESQGNFLTRLAAKAWQPGSCFGEWSQKQTRQFQTLTHPQHLGQSFHVLMQSRAFA